MNEFSLAGFSPGCTMTKRFGDLQGGEKFTTPLVPKRVCIKLAYPPGSQPECNATELTQGLRLNIPDDAECEVRE